MAFVVVLEVEYATDDLEEARALAFRDAARLFQQDDVLVVSADAKVERESITDRCIEDELPITAAYLSEPHQMDVDECIAEAARDGQVR